MPESVHLKDNSKKTLTNLNDDSRNSINLLANKKLSEILKLNESLLLFSGGNVDKVEDNNLFEFYSDNSISTHNLVGFVSVNNLSVRIGSRFSDENDKQFFLQHMLHKINKINLLDLKAGVSNKSVWEQILYMFFPVLLRKAYHQGIFKAYQHKQYNDANIKGRIDIDRHIKYNLPFQRKIAYSNRELSSNNPVIQLIRHTIDYILLKGYQKLLYTDNTIVTAIQTIEALTPDFSRSNRIQVIAASKRIVHPFYTEYEPLRKLCLQILKNESLSFSSTNNQVYGILVDIAWVWEEYLYELLKDKSFIHPENKTGKHKQYLFQGHNTIYPDLYSIERNTVIDAKYKHQGDENRHDIYQAVSYMYRLKSKYGLLVYPEHDKQVISSMNTHTESHGEGISVFIKYAMHVNYKADTFTDYHQEIVQAEERFVQYICNELN